MSVGWADDEGRLGEEERGGDVGRDGRTGQCVVGGGLDCRQCGLRWGDTEFGVEWVAIRKETEW